MTTDFCWHFWDVRACYKALLFLFPNCNTEEFGGHLFFTRILLMLLVKFLQHLTSATYKLKSELFWSFGSKLVTFAEHFFREPLFPTGLCCLHLSLFWAWQVSLWFLFKTFNHIFLAILTQKEIAVRLVQYNKLGVKPLRDH